MTAWTFLVNNFARTPEELRLFDEALTEIKTEHSRQIAEMLRRSVQVWGNSAWADAQREGVLMAANWINGTRNDDAA